MESDWEFEVGGGAPEIEAYWSGFVDLRIAPERTRELVEAIQLPGLGAALEILNRESSPVWTSKCDFWPELEGDEFDPDELNATAGYNGHAMSCYIDLLSKEEHAWSHPAGVEAECIRLCARLRAIPISCCRVDLVIRSAYISCESLDFGITAYITACGSSAPRAKIALQAALSIFAYTISETSKLQ